MTHLARLAPCLALVLGLAGLLQACQVAAPGGQGSTDVTANAVAGDAIEVTALDAPAASPATNPAALAPTGLAAAAPQGAAPASAAATDPIPAPIPAPISESGTAATDPEAPADAAAEAEVVPDPKSDQQMACERKRGRWVTAVGDLKACVYPTGDSGKRCERESQCEGVCLARSGTCPVKPLYGCNEILQDNGARVTLCLE
ncbi:MAG: hypothetical protein NTW20_15825 [Rhodobacterales bacterium]|nr:hypothetical protein [Rhodobacterales bacterium]